VARLDQPGHGDGPRFYVYNLQNSRAEKLAPLLQQAFSGRAQAPAPAAPPTVAPGTPAGQIVSPPPFQAQPSVIQPQVVIQDQRPPATPAGGATGAAAGTGIVRNIQVVADKDNNTLLIVATPPEYTVIETAVKKMDVPSRQVMIEVTMANVTLDDTLEFGVEWLFKGGAPSGRGTGGLFTRSGPFNPAVPTATPTTGSTGNAALALAQGFTYIINNANSRGHPGRAAPARHLRRHEGHRKSAPGRTRQPEGDDQGRRPDSAVPADRRRRHDERLHHDHFAVHRHWRADAGDAAHQRRRAGHARSAGRGEHSGYAADRL
jgi:general secretion pathway protein D